MAYSVSAALHCFKQASEHVVDRQLKALPASVIIFSIFGTAAHYSYEWVDTWQSGMSRGTQKPLIQRVLDSRWVPLRYLPDEGYEATLKEKLLGINAEIATIDDRIADLRSEKPPQIR